MKRMKFFYCHLPLLFKHNNQTIWNSWHSKWERSKAKFSCKIKKRMEKDEKKKIEKQTKSVFKIDCYKDEICLMDESSLEVKATWKVENKIKVPSHCNKIMIIRKKKKKANNWNAKSHWKSSNWNQFKITPESFTVTQITFFSISRFSSIKFFKIVLFLSILDAFWYFSSSIISIARMRKKMRKIEENWKWKISN